MGFFRKIEEAIWTGKTIKDYGMIDEKQMGIRNIKNSVRLTEKEGKKKVIIKQSMTIFFRKCEIF